ncbi:MAG: dTDP-4-dehydrorhamnose 3,5-epimerase [Alphaproteobacteria bacterium]|jgi:dTDP-4-dehydrorhamnose 3,5-epimerase|nr:dTDP-4-dehydrorhamnose 3,5-epimerase [Alphaproteobacteria bacterium]
MTFKELPLEGAYLIELEKHVDERGYFARTFCKQEFTAYGLITDFVQMSTSFNKNKGQIRGMHYQEEPYAETKIVRCTSGSIYDVMVDLRKDSPTYYQWYGEELSADNGKMFYIPKGFAHGYKTLEDDTEIFYMMDEVYIKEAARELNHQQFRVFE